MNLREKQEDMENALSPFASKSADTKGRLVPEEKCDIRTDFQRDRDRIIHSKAFRRLKHKTQVFISPEGDHYRTRLTHTLEVSQIARTIARALNLNEDLTEAIALGHDLGHTPFGHAGEEALNMLSPSGFEHSDQSLRVVDRLEKDGKGLNLTFEVRDGILNHRTAGRPKTQEGKIVRLSDKIAYINHDIDDCTRAGILKPSDIPEEITKVVGTNSSERINVMIRDTIKESAGEDIAMSREMERTVAMLREFMFDKVYNGERAKKEKVKVNAVISLIYKHYMEHPEEMKGEFETLLKEGEDVNTVVCDYIACMTDRFAIKRFSLLFIPSSWNIF